MNTHGYLNTCGYSHSGYPRGYGTGTGIIFIKRVRDEYHTIRTQGYPLTSLVLSSLFFYFIFKSFVQLMDVNIFIINIFIIISYEGFKLRLISYNFFRMRNDICTTILCFYSIILSNKKITKNYQKSYHKIIVFHFKIHFKHK